MVACEARGDGQVEVRRVTAVLIISKERKNSRPEYKCSSKVKTLLEMCRCRFQEATPAFWAPIEVLLTSAFSTLPGFQYGHTADGW